MSEISLRAQKMLRRLQKEKRIEKSRLADEPQHPYLHAKIQTLIALENQIDILLSDTTNSFEEQNALYGVSEAMKFVGKQFAKMGSTQMRKRS